MSDDKGVPCAAPPDSHLPTDRHDRGQAARLLNAKLHAAGIRGWPTLWPTPAQDPPRGRAVSRPTPAREWKQASKKDERAHRELSPRWQPDGSPTVLTTLQRAPTPSTRSQPPRTYIRAQETAPRQNTPWWDTGAHTKPRPKLARMRTRTTPAYTCARDQTPGSTAELEVGVGEGQLRGANEAERVLDNVAERP